MKALKKTQTFRQQTKNQQQQLFIKMPVHRLKKVVKTNTDGITFLLKITEVKSFFENLFSWETHDKEPTIYLNKMSGNNEISIKILR